MKLVDAWRQAGCAVASPPAIHTAAIEPRHFQLSNKYGEYPSHNTVRPEELAATIYHALDIPINNPQDASGLTRTMTTGQPIKELFG